MTDQQQAKWLTEQWFQRNLDALKETLDVSEELKVEMIEFLFDAGFWDRAKLSFPAAVTRFNACLNPSRAEYFKVAEVLALMKRFNRHQFFLAMAEDLGYRTERIPNEALQILETQRLATAIERYNVLQERIAKDIEEAHAHLRQINTAGGKPRVHPGIREGGAFDQPEENVRQLDPSAARNASTKWF